MSERDPLKLLTLTEAAELTGMRFDQVKALVVEGQLAAIQCGRDYRVPRLAIEAYYRNLAEGRARAPRPIPVPIGRKRKEGKTA